MSRKRDTAESILGKKVVRRSPSCRTGDDGLEASDPVPVLSGVPQGSVLGPILFLIFINDLPDKIKSSVRLFADDCVLYRNIHSLQDCLILQKDLDSLGLWEADWQMKFNVAKMSLYESDSALPSKELGFRT